MNKLLKECQKANNKYKEEFRKELNERYNNKIKEKLKKDGYTEEEISNWYFPNIY